jgi:hypothetical protein
VAEVIPLQCVKDEGGAAAVRYPKGANTKQISYKHFNFKFHYGSY